MSIELHDRISVFVTKLQENISRDLAHGKYFELFEFDHLLLTIVGMAVHIHTSKNLNATYSKAAIHLLPCKIHADGDAKVKYYFTPTTKEDNNNGEVKICNTLEGK